MKPLNPTWPEFPCFCVCGKFMGLSEVRHSTRMCRECLKAMFPDNKTPYKEETMNPFANTARAIDPRPNRRLDYHIPIRMAYVCESCQQIHTGWKCPVCDGKDQSWPLAKLLGVEEAR